MSVHDPVPVARELFEAYRRGDRAAMLALAHEDVELKPAVLGAARGHDAVNAGFTGDIEATAHSFEQVGPELVLVGGRLRVFRHGLRDSPAWWLMTIRGGRWVAGASFPSEAAARAAALPLAA